MERKALIDQIIDIEQEMFLAVNNVGGQASCQKDTRTFQGMRRSQALTWSTAMLESYLEDLQVARSQGSNLLAQKYARMMEFTHPDEYALIRNQLPTVDALTRQRIEEIIAVHIAWDQEVARRYPRLRGHGRPATASQDGGARTSAETYMRGELQTYSPRTIEIYHRNTLQAKEAGVNHAEKNLENQVRAYGFASLEEAENSL
jgi:hypothetical protein